jgi:DNA-binding transcriptional LysR family regulator
MLMNVRDLRVVVAVYEARNMLRAGEALRVTPSSVSVRIRNLEKVYGELFVRNPRGVEPTEKAQTLYRYARRTLALLAETDQAVRNTRNSA